MKTDAAFRANLTDSDDAPLLARPGVENWTENLWWIANDARSGIGLMVHLGSSRHDFDVIRQTIMLFLPNGKLATDISFGGLREPSKVRSGTLAMECLKPFEKWRITNNGMAQLSSATELWADSIKQGARVPLTFDVDGLCLSPVWTADGGTDKDQWEKQQWANSHYQQAIRLKGIIRLDGVTYDFDGTGVRDHSRGPRDFSNSWTGHALSSAPFPSGRAFGLMLNYGPDSAVTYRSAYIVKDGIIHRGVPKEIPRLSRAILSSEQMEFELDIAGNVERISVKTTSCGLLTMMLPCDTVIGIFRDRRVDIGLGYAMATFDWEGEIGYGIVERSSLVTALPM